MAQNTFRFAAEEILVDDLHHRKHFSGDILLRIHVGSEISGHVTVTACRAQRFGPDHHLVADVCVGHALHDLSGKRA